MRGQWLIAYCIGAAAFFVTKVATLVLAKTRAVTYNILTEFIFFRVTPLG